MNNHEDYLLKTLPRELLFVVFSFLELEELFALCIISKSWNTFLSSPQMWKEKYLEYFGRPKEEPLSWKEGFLLECKYSLIFKHQDIPKWDIKRSGDIWRYSEDLMESFLDPNGPKVCVQL